MIIRNPYVILGMVVILMFVIIALVKMPATGHTESTSAGDSFRRLIKNKIYREGVLAQVFYVAAQIMCWTFIIQYAERLGIDKATAQIYNMVAMGIFLTSRFISTLLMRYVNARKMLMIFAVGGMFTILGTIFIDGMGGSVLSDSHLCLHVADVPHYLRDSPEGCG